jgi:hypothetical protein
MRFRPRYSLRILLALVALASIPMGWAACQLNWIRQRHEMLAQKLPWRYTQFNAVPAGFPIPKVPWQLRLFGESGRPYIGVMKSQVSLALSLFPEAAIAEIEEGDEGDGKEFIPEGVSIHPR